MLFRSSPKTMERPIKILCFFSFDLLATFLFEFDVVMTDFLKIKLFEHSFIGFLAMGTER